MRELRLGTRGSQLALWQANWVKETVEKNHEGITVNIVRIKTTGDKIQDVPLAQVGGKGLFVKEIEEALLQKEIDVAVHSMKDVPTDLPQGLHIACITEREDPRDVLLTRHCAGFNDLPPGAKVGTASLRRQSQLLNLRPDLEIISLRGNLDTRIRKMTELNLDAIVLAGAGINRLGWGDKITEYLDPAISLPAIGQGALGIETRIDDLEVNNIISFLNHHETSIAVRSERAFLKRLEGGCQVPIAAYGTLENCNLKLRGLVASTNGRRIIKDSMEGIEADAVRIGVDLAERLLDLGAWDILKEVYDTAPPQIT